MLPDEVRAAADPAASAETAMARVDSLSQHPDDEWGYPTCWIDQMAK
jgi:hypothetical protein